MNLVGSRLEGLKQNRASIRVKGRVTRAPGAQGRGSTEAGSRRPLELRAGGARRPGHEGPRSSGQGTHGGRVTKAPGGQGRGLTETGHKGPWKSGQGEPGGRVTKAPGAQGRGSMEARSRRPLSSEIGRAHV